ncbi:hypothetical protein FDC50_14975 [Clostridium botulinum]|nr:hypothetical protein KU41_15340 [Clostridium botulinum]MBY6802805.1 hypothetical protein [Clostridium botulinum]MBY6812924.1 hypothetical protein [Clostridium botulinum]MBY6818949.1 hypothetical protein [Clostridium botulinum]NFJ49554.1 hypothetical protein [Clostridium botulinum]
MKLNLKQIQAVEILLQKLNHHYNYVSANEHLSLIIKINNSLWKGNLVTHTNSYISNYYIDFDGWIESYNYTQNEIFNISSNFNFRKYQHIKLESSYLLLEELISVARTINTFLIDLKPILFNAVNLTDNFELPYLLLNPNDEFEIVSIVSNTIDECIHS